MKLKESGLLDAGRVRTLWKSVDWVESKHQTVDSVAELAKQEGNPTIIVYPMAQVAIEPERAILKAFGRALYASFGQRSKARWKDKLVLAKESQIDDYQERLKKAASYKELVESYPTAVDRLVAIHLSNALLANNVPISEAQNLDVRTWSSTEKFACLETPYSLTPLSSVYCRYEVDKNFADAFADYALTKFDKIYETSVKQRMECLLLDLL